MKDEWKKYGMGYSRNLYAGWRILSVPDDGLVQNLEPIKMFKLNIKRLVFLVSLTTIAIVLDYISTIFGLSRGFTEIHSHYSPLNALLLFWLSSLVLSFLPEGELWDWSCIFIMSFSFFGVINNIIIFTEIFWGVVYVFTIF